jgi:hypothetical protein
VRHVERDRAVTPGIGNAIAPESGATEADGDEMGSGA